MMKREILDKSIMSLANKQFVFSAVLISYFVRAIFPIVTYFFYFSLIFSIIILAKNTNKISFRNSKLDYNYFLGLLVIVIYLLNIINYRGSSEVKLVLIKELVHGFIVLFLILYFDLFINIKKLNFLDTLTNMAFWVMLFIGIASIMRMFLLLAGYNISFPFFYETSSLNINVVRDNNVYALFFIIISIVSIQSSIYLKHLSKWVTWAASFVFLLNIGFSFSRRGYILYLLLLFYLFVKNVERRSFKRTILNFSKLIFPLLLFLGIIYGGLYHFKGRILSNESWKNKTINSLYKINTIVNQSESIESFSQRFYDFLYTSKDAEEINLLYNGDFRAGTMFWKYTLESDQDKVEHIVKRWKDKNYLRIKRGKGKWYFQLLYSGRKIFYYADTNYKLSFKFRVVEGNSEEVFKVGLYSKQIESKYINLHKKITKIDDDWFLCESQFIFNIDVDGAVGYINDLRQGSIIDVAEFKLYSTSSLPEANYVDEIQLVKFEDKSTKNIFINPRMQRVKVAINIYSEYSFINKLMGNGFTYIDLFKEHFHSKRKIEYPHNPFLSALLYSGLIGLFLHLLLLFLSIRKYVADRINLKDLMFVFFLVFLFSSVSTNSIFGFPLLFFLIMIPFVITKKN